MELARCALATRGERAGRPNTVSIGNAAVGVTRGGGQNRSAAEIAQLTVSKYLGNARATMALLLIFRDAGAGLRRILQFEN